MTSSQTRAGLLVAAALCLTRIGCCTSLEVHDDGQKEPVPLGAQTLLRRPLSSQRDSQRQSTWTAGDDTKWRVAPGDRDRARGALGQALGAFPPVRRVAVALKKRRPEMDSSGFYGDTFNGGLGYFDTMKRRPEMDSSGFYGDTFNGGMGYFDTMKKRRPEMDSSGFYGDTFNGGMGYFDTMKKRRPEMDSSGFYGDTFNGGMGYFDTMKKRRPEMDSSGFYGDTFNGGLGYFDTMKRRLTSKRRPEMDSSGFHGDVFSNGFGFFDTMKRRAAEAGSDEDGSPGGAGPEFDAIKNLQSHQTQSKMADGEQGNGSEIQGGRFFGASRGALDAKR
ncbi:uncharacterized protein LOC122393691 [Amphibalanus amphitrite]|uniref:uncharacterized protein LOC122393691 n=1 Tax=Amphibalanus amphitrite TaxID=1232801 RepID=UPI001C929AE9|nr:uncharacterized protein LOC122393691 [Amphibalanus amphitrite]